MGNTSSTLKTLVKNFGKVVMLKDGIATVVGLHSVKSGEIVYILKNSKSIFSNKKKDKFVKGLVLNLNIEDINVIILGNERLVSEGNLVYRSEKLLKIDAGLKLFGRVSDAVGNLKDKLNKDFLFDNFIEKFILVEKKATGIVDREPVNKPLRTGIKSVDSLVPIGRGQRELIIGDRQTGKTSIAIDIILNHVLLNNSFLLKDVGLNVNKLRDIVWFVYAAIGQKQSTVSEIYSKLKQKNGLWYTSIVAATAAETAPLQFLTPYTACAIGEYIRDVLGGHCTVIYDDLSKHAVSYRQMSLLLRRPPGREAFPGDVFYVHSRLLERAGSLNDKFLMYKFFDFDSNNSFSQVLLVKRGTLTAFPVIETQAGDVSAYIPTNVISITDGQIFLETELFYRGIRPAVNVGLSVSRVGSAAQPSLMKRVAGPLKMELAQFREIEGFAKLGANLDEHTYRLLVRGENIIELLKQDLNKPLSLFEQVLSIFLGVGYSSNWLNDILKVSNIFTFQFLDFVRVRVSWLEWFRTRSLAFSISDVKSLVNILIFFSDRVGLKKVMESFTVENMMNVLISRCPYIFFDDIVFMYLFETGVFNGDLVFKNVSETQDGSPDYSLLDSVCLDRFYLLNEDNILKRKDNFRVFENGVTHPFNFFEFKESYDSIFNFMGGDLSNSFFFKFRNFVISLFQSDCYINDEANNLKYLSFPNQIDYDNYGKIDVNCEEINRDNYNSEFFFSSTSINSGFEMSFLKVFFPGISNLVFLVYSFVNFFIKLKTSIFFEKLFLFFGTLNLKDLSYCYKFKLSSIISLDNVFNLKQLQLKQTFNFIIRRLVNI